MTGATRFALVLLAATVAAVAFGITHAQSDRPERSVVRILNFSQRGDWYSPWDVSKVSESSGSGFVIEGGLVMTNAHVISDSRLLLIQAHNDPEPHVAEVVHVAHDCDLALVRPQEPEDLREVPPLEFGGVPRLGSAVDTLGYPMGGTQVSSTRGVVSRIEDQLYVHSGKDVHLTVQTDAAINPGNSGGPVLQEDRVVGVAFQANLDLQSVGFFIPMEVIERFLRDVRDGRYDGYPELGAETEGLANRATRKLAGMDENESGVRVFRVYPESSADGKIEIGDIILAVQGRPVGNDGSVADGEFRIPFGLLVDRMQVGEQVAVRVLRDGERIDLDIPLTRYLPADIQGNLYDEMPRYFVYAGLVFVPLNRETMATYGPNWIADADREMIHEFLIRPLFEPDLFPRERVVLLRKLDHPVNADMAWYRNQVVERVNGREITSLRDLVETLERYDGDYQLIEFSNLRRFGVLDRRLAEESNEEILHRYGISKDRNL